MDLRSLPAKVLAWTIQPNACGMKRPPASLHSASVATPSGPNTGRPLLVWYHWSFCPRGGTHQLICLCQCATLRGTRSLRSSSDARFDAVYIAPINTNSPLAFFLYRSEVGRAGLKLSWLRTAFQPFVKWYCG